MQPEQSPSLYDRLGGVHNIARIVDDLIDRVMTDPRLNKNPAVDEAHKRISPASFKYLLTEMLCSAAGGPQMYSGRGMRDSHRHLAIQEDEWMSFMDDLQQSLDRFQVPAAEQQHVVAIMDSTKSGIVMGSPPASEPAELSPR
jgi:hemoglobin